jgi:hypothetical protein
MMIGKPAGDESMIPKSGIRFLEKIMLKRTIWIMSDSIEWIVVQGRSPRDSVHVNGRR